MHCYKPDRHSRQAALRKLPISVDNRMSEFGFSVYRGEPSIGHIGEDNFKAVFIGAQVPELLNSRGL